MARPARTILFSALLLIPCAAVRGLERFPPPDFESGYEQPETTVPPPRSGIYEYVDPAVLLATLSLASYLVLRRRSRRAIFVLAVFSLLYFGFWRKGCICPIGAIQNVTLMIFDSGYAIPVVAVIFFLLPLVFTLFFGRTFCAAVCPLGAAQDLVL
ncbi:MAG: 4Fe-4S binding protein, partial [Phycisphaerales bacterium]